MEVMETVNFKDWVWAPIIRGATFLLEKSWKLTNESDDHLPGWNFEIFRLANLRNLAFRDDTTMATVSIMAYITPEVK